MDIKQLASQFAVNGNVCSSKEFGSGHINQTYLVHTDTECAYVLQKINQYVFREPKKVMENVIAVTQFLQAKDPDPRHALHFIPSVKGDYWAIDSDGDFWRMYEFVEGFCLDQSESLQDLYQSALAFGHFQMLLADFPAETLHETIPHFHDTPDRFRQLRCAVEENRSGRLDAARDTLDTMLQHEKLACSLQPLLEAGKLPLRVTHNDTKLNNVLLDINTRQYICVLDLDTVMPGLSLFDFGDAVRFGAATAAEDTTDLASMTMDLEAFRAYVRGFLQTAVTLTDLEIKLLPVGAIAMTLETASRFLKDYLDGDLYFKTAYPEHNLVRAKAQLKLGLDMIEKLPLMDEIVAQERASLHS